jgi:II/X family phage/plasmid replication protein
VIDWLKLRFPLVPDREIGGDRVMLIDPDGTITWQKLRPLEVVGSHEGSLRASCCPITRQLVIDGNPAKFFQGHNLFGSEDVLGLSLAAADAVFSRVDLAPPRHVLELLDAGEFDLARIDLTGMYSLGARSSVRAAIRALSDRARFKHRGRGQLTREGTLYFGKHSRRWGAKFYAKGDEIESKGHRIPSELMHACELAAWADDKLRIEFVIRGKELKQRELDRVSAWCDTKPQELYRELLAKLEMPDMIELPGETLEELPGRLRLAYDAWRRGEDLRAKLSRATYYRYRQELLKRGIDIASLQPKEPASNVVPLLRIIEARPAEVPSWARGTPLYFEPGRRRLAG